MLLRLEGVFPCSIIRRVNRFVVTIKVSRSIYGAYMANTGRLKDLVREGKRGYCLFNKGKMKYRLFAIKESGKGALIDTIMQMKAFEAAIKIIPWLHTCEIVKRNVRIGNSTIDYLFRCEGKPFYLEVKSAVLRRDLYYAAYPDCPTERGRRHIMELIKLASNGKRAGIVFIAALSNIKKFKPNPEGDPKIPQLLKEAANIGVTIKAIGMYYEPKDESIRLYSPDLPVEI